ncbi:MAG: hypothetical protein CMJ49_13690 [Planctomycetaceae bacterium]|nr:hypothetical protein [Planctomycetaceae bacterium]
MAGREVVTCVMEPGDVLLFHDLTAHRSVDNTSDRIRWSIDIRYCSATATKLVEKSGRGYYAFSGADATRVGSYEDWAGQYDYDGEF